MKTVGLLTEIKLSSVIQETIPNVLLSPSFVQVQMNNCENSTNVNTSSISYSRNPVIV